MIEYDHEQQRRLVFAKFSKYAYLNKDEAEALAKVEGFPKTEFIDIEGAQKYLKLIQLQEIKYIKGLKKK